MRFRLGETFRSVFYAPFYVALHRGLFARHGLDLSVQTFGDGRLMLAAMERGELDAGIGGIMRSLVAYDRRAELVPIHIARINDRDGFFLLGHRPGFDWPDLLDHRLILFSEAPTPWYVLRAFLRDRGLDPDRIQAIGDVPVDRVAAAFRAGEAEFLEAPAPVVEDLLRNGGGCLLKAMGEEVPPLPYSSYCVPPGALERNREPIHALVAAHIEALRWMQQTDGREIWEAVRLSFPNDDPEILQPAVERYQRLGTWSSDATLPRESFERLALTLQRGGLIQRIAPYELVCRDELVRAE